MKVLSRETLQLRPPEKVGGNINPGRGGIAVHWGGEALAIRSHSDCIKAWRAWQRHHMDVKGWADIAYSWGICDHGYVLTGRGWGVRTAANGTNDANTRYLAICWIGGEGETPSIPALAAFDDMITYCRSRGAGLEVKPHRALTSTDCPGNILAEFARSRNGVASAAPAFPLPSGWYFGPQEGPKESVSGYHGHREDLRVWQAKAGISADGLYGPSTRNSALKIQTKHGLVRDGLIGAETWGATWAK